MGSMPLDVVRLIEELEEIRDEKNLSKDDFAIKELGVSAPTFKRWTLGKSQPNAENLMKITKFLENHRTDN